MNAMVGDLKQAYDYLSEKKENQEKIEL